MDYAIFDACRAGFSRVLLIIREELEEVFRAHLRGRWPEELDVVFHHQRIDDLPGVAAVPAGPLAAVLKERGKPWGTAHALLTARAHLADPFVLLNADDFYGESAFLQASGSLSEGALSDVGQVPTFGLVTYTLSDTLSEHGGVSRGICEVDVRGWLKGIREVLEIRRGNEGISGRTVPGQGLALEGTEPISTNFWIFTPEVFPHLEVGFREFLGTLTSAPGGSGGSGEAQSSAKEPEFLIPSEVNRLLVRGEARVRVLRTQDPFFGITHPKDRERVAGGLRGLIREGHYPDPLWASGAEAGPG